MMCMSIFWFLFSFSLYNTPSTFKSEPNHISYMPWGQIHSMAWES